MENKVSRQQIADALRRYGMPEADLPTMVAIAGAESGYDLKAFNPRGRDLSYGPFQINMLGDMGKERRQRYGLTSNDQLFDLENNVRAAVDIYKTQGLGAWGAYTNQSYKNFMNPQQLPNGVGGPSLPPPPLQNYSFDEDGNLVATPVGAGSSTGDTYNVYNINTNGKEVEGSDFEKKLVESLKLDLFRKATKEQDEGGYDPMKLLKQYGYLQPSQYLNFLNQ